MPLSLAWFNAQDASPRLTAPEKRSSEAQLENRQLRTRMLAPQRRGLSRERKFFRESKQGGSDSPLARSDANAQGFISIASSGATAAPAPTAIMGRG